MTISPTRGPDISIHAPTRGATLTDLGYEVEFKISIHAPTRGATKASVALFYGYVFQSTLLQEERQL